MNRKHFLILLVLVLVLGAGGLKQWRTQTSSWGGGGATIGQKLLGEFVVNDVAQIFVKRGTNELTLAKKSDLWRVTQRGDYPANFPEISGLLLKLKDLKVVQTETVGPSQLPRLELAPSGASLPTTVEFRDADGKAIKTLLLGKKHMKSGGQKSPMEEAGDGGFPDGRYVQAGGASDHVVLISDPLANLEPNPEPWLNKDFFKVEKARTIAVTFPQTTNSWKLVRETEGGALKLAEPTPGEELDAGKASGVGNPFASPSFDDVVVGATPEQTGLNQPKVVAIETFYGFNYTIKVGAKTNENYFLTLTVAATLPKERTAGKDEKPEDKTKLDKEFADQQQKLGEKLAAEKVFEPWTYLVSGWTVDSLLKERAQLLIEKKDTAKPEAKPDEAPLLEPK